MTDAHIHHIVVLVIPGSSWSFLWTTSWSYMQINQNETLVLIGAKQNWTATMFHCQGKARLPMVSRDPLWADICLPFHLQGISASVNKFQQKLPGELVWGYQNILERFFFSQEGTAADLLCHFYSALDSKAMMNSVAWTVYCKNAVYDWNIHSSFSCQRGIQEFGLLFLFVYMFVDFLKILLIIEKTMV